MTANFNRSTAIAALLALGGLAACGGSGGEGAYLTIEGSTSVLIPYNGSARLAVRYHDAETGLAFAARVRPACAPAAAHRGGVRSAFAPCPPTFACRSSRRRGR